MLSEPVKRMSVEIKHNWRRRRLLRPINLLVYGADQPVVDGTEEVGCCILNSRTFDPLKYNLTN